MANLPRAVQQQVEAAEALLATQNQPEAQPTVPADEPAPAPEPVATPEPPAESVWERKYKTLQGLFNAEVPKLQQQNKELTAQLRDAIERMDKLEKQAPTTQPPAPDPKDVDNFGSDLVEMVQRQTQHVLASVAGKVDAVAADLEKRLSQVEQALKGTTQTVAMTAEEVFFNRLATAVPDWEQINSNEMFLTWLAEADPVYGQPRQTALSAAQQSLDVARVAAIFNAFKAAHQPKATTAPSPLAKQVSPKSAGAAPPTPTDKPVFTTAQVDAFYRDVAQKKYRGREAEAAQIEAMINEALSEQRVR